MKRVQLGYKAYDLHELTCHFVAETAGLYAEQGLEVTLVDTRLVRDQDLPAEHFSAACGSAAIRWLHGERLKVVLIAAERPMFWLYSYDKSVDVDDLRGRTIATWPEAAPPAKFLRFVLDDLGLREDANIKYVPARDDSHRLQMLSAGDVAAALVSSAIPPKEVRTLGFTELLCLGDLVQLPTTGLAVTLAAFQNRETVLAMRNAHRSALDLIRKDPASLAKAFQVGCLPGTDDFSSVRELVHNFYSIDGGISGHNAISGLARFANFLQVSPPSEPDDLYDCFNPVASSPATLSD